VLLEDVPEIRSLAWAGPDHVIQWVAPAEYESTVIGFDPRNDPRRSDAVEAAVATRKPMLSKFTDLRIGGEGGIVYVPIYKGEEFKGVLSAALGRGNWLESLLGGRFPDHRLELIEDGAVKLAVGADEPPAASEWAQELPLSVYNARWILRVIPSAYYIRGSVSRLPDAGLVLGTLLATLLALATYLFQAARLRTRELKRANQRLMQDISRRSHAQQ